MGGTVPLGYRVENRKLIISEPEDEIIRTIFERFVRIGSGSMISRQLHEEHVTTRSGRPIDRAVLYKILNNRVYIGEAVHKGVAYPGEHKPIISRDLWDKVHAILKESPRKRAQQTRCQTPSLLKGLIFAPSGCAMSPTHTRRRGRLYRYYVSQTVLKRGPETCPVRRVPAAEIEAIVIAQIRQMLTAPEIIATTWHHARFEIDGLTEADVREALLQFEPLWDELFPAEHARLVQMLVERIDVGTDGIDIKLRVDGIASLVREVNARAQAETREAA